MSADRAGQVKGSDLPKTGDDRMTYSLLLGLVFLSGFAALVYELLWFRQLGLVFGNTVHAAATVLTAFMVGLAWGADRARKWVERTTSPIRLFGAVEAGIGVYALVVPTALTAVTRIYQICALHMPPAGAMLTGLRFVLALIVLCVPTVLMGASLPVLSEAALRSRDRFAARLGLLYGCNTAGAALGALACGFVLISQLGVQATNLLAASLNLAIGAAAYWAGRSSKCTPPPHTDQPALQGQMPWLAGLLSVAAFAGFLALAFETVWFRALVLVFGSTSHSFAIMVTCFLFGLVIGAAAFGRFSQKPEHAAWILTISLTGIGLWTLASILLYQWAPDFLLESLVRSDFSYSGMILAKAALATLFLFPLAGFSGLAFTAVVRLIRDRVASSGKAVASAFSVNALGSAAGSAVGGFVLLPTVGLERSLLILGLAALLAGMVILWCSMNGATGPRLAFAGTAIAAAACIRLATPAWDPLVLSAGPYFSPRTHVAGDTVVFRESLNSVELLYYHEGTTASVSVTRSMDGRLHFNSDGKVEADTSPQSMVLQRMMGHLPMLLHPNPRRALNIGLGAGVTSGALSCYPDVQIDIADIEPAVTNVAAVWAERNHKLIERGCFRLYVNDGRNHLLVTTNRYDVITSDPFEPIVAGAASLYTVEHFQLARSRLTPGGIMAQFLPLYELSREDVLMILRTFVHVFPRSSVFFTGTDTVLLGLSDGAEIRLDTATRHFQIEAVRGSLAEIGVDRPERLLDMLVMDIEPGVSTIEDGAVNTDNHPFIEFSAPKSALHYLTDTNQKILLDRFKDLPSAYLTGLKPEVVADVARGREALRKVLQASIHRSHGELEKTVRLLTEAHDLAPNSPIIRNELGMSLVMLARQTAKPDEAKAYYRKAMAVNPKNFWPYYHLQLHALSQKENVLAADYLQKALMVFPDSAIFIAMRGRQRGLAGDHEGACRDLETALEALPRRADFWNIYADFLERAGRHEESETARERAENLGG